MLKASDPTIPNEVETLLRNMVAKDPRRRFRSAALMAKAVRECRLQLQSTVQPAVKEDHAVVTVENQVSHSSFWLRRIAPLRLLPQVKIKIAQYIS